MAYVGEVLARTTESQGGYFYLALSTVNFNSTTFGGSAPFGSYLVMAVPEPGAGTLAGLGVLSLVLARRRAIAWV